ncbi:SDR family oxidoreductase [Sphingomonas parva]|uniref:SDR family oxidoreductase n=1 Tax=Sphingomonas parva TaxID=2555898 RepID=A0A4Y8ZLT7_9SPHN|nr:SDR family oxidoreductase [Sphingomonas parva]TFI56973.1 SDR family oxidoreductase [Sphingomonas parva]
MPTVLVTGANRGLGLEFARQYAAEGWDVIATVRDVSSAGDLRAAAPGARIETLEVADFRAVEAFARALGGTPLDRLVANAGVSKAHRIQSAADAETWLDVLAVNSVAPTLLAGLLAKNVAAAGGRMAAVTSRMGSIADSSGGYVAYRSSKAALNAAWHALVPHIGVPLVLLHPGWVQTDMGGAAATITPEESVRGMRAVIERLPPERSGAFLDYQGQSIPW